MEPNYNPTVEASQTPGEDCYDGWGQSSEPLTGTNQILPVRGRGPTFG